MKFWRISRIFIVGYNFKNKKDDSNAAEKNIIGLIEQTYIDYQKMSREFATAQLCS